MGESSSEDEKGCQWWERDEYCWNGRNNRHCGVERFLAVLKKKYLPEIMKQMNSIRDEIRD